VALLLLEICRHGKRAVDQTGNFGGLMISFTHVTLGVSSSKRQKKEIVSTQQEKGQIKQK
jgi:hypothetical protein